MSAFDPKQTFAATSIRTFSAPTFDMRGCAKAQPLGSPLDGRVRRHFGCSARWRVDADPEARDLPFLLRLHAPDLATAPAKRRCTIAACSTVEADAGNSCWSSVKAADCRSAPERQLVRRTRLLL